jgi:hypothetical protein
MKTSFKEEKDLFFESALLLCMKQLATDSSNFTCSLHCCMLFMSCLCSAVLALCRPRVHALAGTAFAAVCPEASTHLQEASARAHVTAPLAHQLILRGSGTDNTIDDDVDRRPEDCANDLAGPAAAQVASPSEASAWLERALAQVSQVASDLTGVLNQKDARALADLVVLLWALSASEPLALALMQPAIDLPHGMECAPTFFFFNFD